MQKSVRFFADLLFDLLRTKCSMFSEFFVRCSTDYEAEYSAALCTTGSGAMCTIPNGRICNINTCLFGLKNRRNRWYTNHWIDYKFEEG